MQTFISCVNISCMNISCVNGLEIETDHHLLGARTGAALLLSLQYVLQ
jgi:hypothetical protein